MSTYEANSFKGYLYITGTSLEAKASFQYLKNSISAGTTKTTGGVTANTGASGSTDLLYTDYLYANSCSGAVATLLHFQSVGTDGKFRITCMDTNSGQYLGISNLGYMRAYHSDNDCTHFIFCKPGGPKLQLSDMPERVNEGLRMYSSQGDVDLYKKSYAYGSEHEWNAYLGSRTDGDKLAGRFKLVIVERDVGKN